jgi:hypothetical protein
MRALKVGCNRQFIHAGSLVHAVQQRHEGNERVVWSVSNKWLWWPFTIYIIVHSRELGLVRLCSLSVTTSIHHCIRCVDVTQSECIQFRWLDSRLGRLCINKWHLYRVANTDEKVSGFGCKKSVGSCLYKYTESTLRARQSVHRRIEAGWSLFQVYFGISKYYDKISHKYCMNSGGFSDET